MSELSLKHGLRFEDLYSHAGLARLDQSFRAELAKSDAELAARLDAARLDPDSLGPKPEADLLLAVAPYFEDFVADLFGISSEVQVLAAKHNALSPLYACKRLFVQRRAAKAVKADEIEGLDGRELEAELLAVLGISKFDELAFARAVMSWLDDEPAHESPLAFAARYAAWATLSQAGRARHAGSVLFHIPAKLDPIHLVHVEKTNRDGVTMLGLPAEKQRRREGFALTDERMDMVGALDHAHYCIVCHNQGKDSCSKGLKDKKTGAYQKSALGVSLPGCPLDERISEMNSLKSEGHAIAALAAVTIDNPMAAATGHRICNDCMKACIYQKQEPVNIPQVETRSLTDVLDLPWGFEIYSLLTRWNPLNLRRPVPKADSGYKVLVVGMGPAGFTLAHHLLNEGHAVAGIDGLKIEPLNAALSGVNADGSRVPFKPVRDWTSLRENLDDRTMAGFGGVAEYGITVRWDKNFLKLVRLLLERRASFALYGGVRFGGTITVEDAFAMGFDHIALCAGAGRPTFINMPNALARGVRQASDFLMGLQLTGAAKADSIANLVVRLPVVVIGGGLTAIDTATESLAYYPVQVEKFLSRYETLIAERGEAAVRARWTPSEAELADEFLAHGRAIRAERDAAKRENREAKIRELVQSWGGATIAYRRWLIDSPSYTLNHEEVEKAMEEGISFAEGLSPVEVEIDESGHAKALECARMESGDDGRLQDTGETVFLPARTILVAAGTQPNTVLARESNTPIALDGRHFQAVDEDGNPVHPERSPKPAKTQVLMAVEKDGKRVSFFGDLHPSFAGNVVKAMASAKRGYPVVSRTLAKRKAEGPSARELFATLNRDLRPRVHAVNRLTPTIIEVVVEAPAAARAFRPGQFFRLQNLETTAPVVDGTRLAMEGLALTGAWVDKDKGLVSVIVLEMGGSSDLCAMLKPGEPVVLMGPTGTPTHTPARETVLLVGGGLGNAVLFSIGKALRAAGSKVLYFAGYKKRIDRYKVEEIEAAADVVVWACDEAPGFTADRPQDAAFVGNIVEAIKAYGEGKLGAPAINLSEVDRIVAIGSDAMMAAVGRARHGVLQPLLKPEHAAIGSINSPMQCMMKEICAQCLQPHVDPKTGETTVVFSCFNQDQPLDEVNFAGLRDRLSQNGVQEKLTAQWIDRCLKRLGARTATAAE
ncbi:MAG TPA: FAD-dependent oxidoreductase [Alphaproteobacteria bacterium]|nr:FAD-dependent oxidoreductase [Alphaproteobacteria bacterium]